MWGGQGDTQAGLTPPGARPGPYGRPPGCGPVPDGTTPVCQGRSEQGGAPGRSQPSFPTAFLGAGRSRWDKVSGQSQAGPELAGTPALACTPGGHLCLPSALVTSPPPCRVCPVCWAAVMTVLGTAVASHGEGHKSRAWLSPGTDSTTGTGHRSPPCSPPSHSGGDSVSPARTVGSPVGGGPCPSSRDNHNLSPQLFRDTGHQRGRLGGPEP